MELSFRWYGPKDPVSLSDIRQCNADFVVTSLHQIPYGEKWTDREIKKRIKDQVSQKLKEKKYKYSNELFEFAEKRVMLFQIDKDWREHLAAMDMLRGSVNLRALGGRDPFYEYKKESFDYFDEMLSNQNERVLKTLFGIELVSENKKENNTNIFIHNNKLPSWFPQAPEIL